MKPIVCLGAALVDDAFTCVAEPAPGTSNPAVHRRNAGGVARNVAHHLAQLGHPVELVAHLSTDNDGDWLMELFGGGATSSTEGKSTEPAPSSRRVPSPSTGSTLITSAPRSARIMPQVGPMTMWVNSTTRSPL